jgi:hypothetical protein
MCAYNKVLKKRVVWLGSDIASFKLENNDRRDPNNVEIATSSRNSDGTCLPNNQSLHQSINFAQNTLEIG